MTQKPQPEEWHSENSEKCSQEEMPQFALGSKTLFGPELFENTGMKDVPLANNQINGGQGLLKIGA